jgi:hypothetical protein
MHIFKRVGKSSFPDEEDFFDGPKILASNLLGVPMERRSILVAFDFHHEETVVFRAARWYILKTRNRNLGKVLQWKMLVYVTAVWSIVRQFGIFGTFGILCGHLVYTWGHVVYFMVIWYIFPVLVCCTKKNLATLQSFWP